MMKKLFIGFLLSFLYLAWASAQSVDNYKFESSTGTYTALTDGTALTQIPDDGSDVGPFVYDAASREAIDNTSMETKTIAGIDMGFDFKLGGATYRKFAVTGYGYVLLGKADADIAFTQWLMGNMSPAYSLTAVGMAQGGGKKVYNLAVKYAVTGNPGAKVLTVQFSDISYDQPDGENRMSYQIKFYEQDSKVEMVFNGYEKSGMTTVYLGLVAGGKSHFRKTSDGDFSTTTQEEPKRIFNTKFPAGLTYTFGLPDPCTEPTYAVQNIKLMPKSNEMGIEVLVDTAGRQADGVVLIVSDKAITENPDGMVFVKGEEALGGMVLAAGSWDDRDLKNQDRTHLKFTHGDSKTNPLNPNTTYHYTVYMANTDHCLANYTEPVSKKEATATTAPAELKIIESSLSEVKFSAKTNDLDEEIAILVTTGHGKDEKNRVVYTGNFADISADTKVGDVFYVEDNNKIIIDSTKVLYVGAAGEAITCPVTLESNRVYYFAAVSKGKDNGFYSTKTVQAEPLLTPASLPYTDNFKKNFPINEANPFIGGYAGTKNFASSNSVYSTMAVGGPSEAILMIPALDFPTDSNVLVDISYNLDPWTYNSEKVEGDSIALEISTDGGKTFKTLKAVHKNTDNLTLGKVILSDYLGAKQAVLRLRAVCVNTEKVFRIIMESIKITTLPFCPAPGAPYVDDYIYGGTLGLKWRAGENGETQWNISTAPVVAEGQEPVWSRSVLVEKKPYYLTGLADREKYNVRVQAVCAGGRTSGWVAAQVQAGRVPSFTEDFDHIAFEENRYTGEVEPQLPANWQNGCNGISEYSFSWYSGYGKFYEYKTRETITAESTGYNGSLAFDMQKNGYIHLLQTPMVELNPAEKPQLTFNAAFGSWVENAFVSMPADNQKDTMRLAMWVCDSGRFERVNMQDAPAKEWRIAELATWHEGKTITINLSEYVSEPKVVSVVMAVYTEPVAGTEINMLYLDNIGIVNTEPLARSLKVAALSAEAATIQWVADQNVEKWLVKLEGGSLTAPRFFAEVAGNTQVVDGLEAEKTYTVSVTPAANGQEASVERWVSVTFNTPAATCAEVTDLTVSEITRKSAVLTWQGDAADGYLIQYRPVTQPGTTPMEYINVEVPANTYTYMLSGLHPQTIYEGGVTAICNKPAGLESDRADFENFTTKAVTCFVPTDTRISDLGAKVTEVSWTGTSDGYQVAWMVSYSNSWIYSEVVSESVYTITDLNYNGWYTFKVRGVCAAGDSSEWSETRNFHTLARPACATPTNLRVEALTQTSADLKWDYVEAEEGDLINFTLRHREASVQTWDSIKEVEGTTYAIQDMKPKTAYVWAVMAICQDDRNSEGWAQLRFETLGQDTVPGNDTTAVEDLKLATGLYVAAAQGQIHVMNPKAVRIDNIRIYGLSGQRLEQYAIRSNDNVILTTEVRKRVAVVEVESEGRFIRFKVMLP